MIKIVDLKKEYGKLKVLKGISMQFPNNGFIALTGSSGTGKSTLLNLIGLLDSQSSGTIEINGTYMQKLSENERNNFRRANIGFVFQDSYLLSQINVFDNIKLSLPKNNDINYEEVIDETLSKLGILEKKYSSTNTLSGGEQQRVAIARAMINNPKVVLADEPTGNLDDENSDNIFSTLANLSEERLVILVTHDKERANKYCNSVYELSEGYIQVIRKKEKFFDKEFYKKTGKQNYSTNWSLMTKLSIKYFSEYRLKIIPMILTIALALFGVGFSYAMNEATVVQLEEISNGFLETNLLRVRRRSTGTLDYYLLGNLPIKETDVEYLRDGENIEYLEIDYNISFDIEYNNVTYYDIGYRIFSSNEFYENKYKDLDLTGTFPTDSNTIVLGVDLIEKIYGGNYSVNEIIGSEIVLSNSLGMTDNIVEIVGVNNSRDVNGVYVSFLNESLLLEVREHSQSNYLEMTTEKCYEYDPPNNFLNICRGKTNYASVSEFTQEISLEIGKLPENDNEILISTMSLYLNQTIFFDEELTLIDIQDMSDDNWRTLSDTNIKFIANDLYDDLKIVGIYSTNSENDVGGNGVLVSDGLKELLDMSYPYFINIYMFNNNEAVETIVGLENEGYQVDYPYEHLVVGVENRLESFKLMIYVILIFAIILSISMLYSFTSKNIISRRKEIGLMQAIGLRKTSTLYIFVMESIYITFISAIVACGTLVLVNNFLLVSIFSGGSTNDIIHANATTYVIIFICSLIFAVLVSFVTSLRIISLKPIDALRG